MAEASFSDDFRRNFLTGIAALFPILVTLFLFTWLYRQLDGTLGEWTNGVFREVLARNEQLFQFVFPGASGVPMDTGGRRAYAAQHFPGFVGVAFGLMLLAVGVYLAGMFLRGYIGRRLMDAVNRFFERFPVIKAIYPHARQVGDLLFGQGGRRRFSAVVAVQYPRRGVYTVGFQTGDGIASLSAKSGQDLVAVFVPTSPTPLTGMVILVPAQEVVRLDMTVDEAFRFCLTAGMLSSAGHQRVLHAGGTPEAGAGAKEQDGSGGLVPTAPPASAKPESPEGG